MTSYSLRGHTECNTMGFETVLNLLSSIECPYDIIYGELKAKKKSTRGYRDRNSYSKGWSLVRVLETIIMTIYFVIDSVLQYET